MFNCYVILYVFRYDANLQTLCFVSDSEHKIIPIKKQISDTEHQNIYDCIYDLLDEYLGQKSEFSTILLIDAIRQDNDIILNYMCKVPIDCKMINGYNIPSSLACADLGVRKAIRYV
jgi:hypothetical protein